MRRFLMAMVWGLLTVGSVSAQGLEYKPIDTNKLVVQPTDAATGIFSGTTRYVSRVVASVIDKDGFVRTVNSLFGRSSQPSGVQSGYSPLPLPGSYPSTQYKSAFSPSMPTSQTFGKSPGR